MAMLSQSCRREVETALDRDAEPSIECKQDIQNALSGFSQDLEPGEVPELGPEPFLVRRASLVAGGVAFVGVVALLFRILRRRAEVPGKKKKAGKKKDKSGKPKSS